jgi:hypothetical protein
MKKFGHIYGFSVVLLVLMISSCDKTVPTLPEASAPIFTLDGEFDGEAISLIAGDENTYMHTGSEIVNGVSLFNGKLSNGDFSVEIGFFDGFLDQPDRNPSENLANVTPLFVQQPTEPLVYLDKNFLGNPNIQSVVWFINGVYAGENNVPIEAPGKYNVCAFITFANNDEAQLCDEVIVGYSKSANFNIDFMSQSNVVNASTNCVGSSAHCAQWFLDGTQILGEVGGLIQYDSPGQLHTLSSEVHFDNDVIRRRSVLIDEGGNGNSVGDFSIFELISNYDDPYQDFNVCIEIQSDGVTYSSIYADNSLSTCDISNVEHYGKNAAGKNVYEVSATINAFVKSSISEKIIPVTFSTVFGLEID